ncbi:MAG: SDR family oxidoreductase [Clostridia bacterium]|nr:SDR family oxidoreductase [Clostridia bacterium]
MNSNNINNSNQFPKTFPEQQQDVNPGKESIMEPKPIFDSPEYVGTGKLKNKVAIITGGDSGIGKAVAVFFAKEGADIVIAYLNENNDANETKNYIENLGAKCTIIAGDLKDENFCKKVVDTTISTYGHLDILVNNAAILYNKNSIEDITSEQLENTFKTNIFSFFYITKAALKHLKNGSSIINTSSVTAFKGSKTLIDYASTKGAIISFTRSLAISLVDMGIRVNAVSPGPIWTPLQPSSMKAEDIKTFGSDTLIKRAGQPVELAPTYVYLASDDSTYVTGQTLHVNGGEYFG